MTGTTTPRATQALTIRPIDGPEELSLFSRLPYVFNEELEAPALHRVTQRRIAFLTDVYAELGLPAPRARYQAVSAYAAYVGWMQLRRATPTVLPEIAEDPEALTHLVEHLVLASTGP